jgi:AraC-like DNA-binding protein
MSIPATVTALSAMPGTGNEGIGKTITFKVKLSKSVTVGGGTPALTLDDGGIATYSAGSGSSLLTFTYQVAGGDSSVASLAVTGIDLNGAAVKDGTGDATDFTNLPTVFTNLHVDTTIPTVIQAAASPSTGDEGVGKAIYVQLTFSETVKVAGGPPALTLNDGGTATYVSGSRTNTLKFKYHSLPRLGVGSVSLTSCRTWHPRESGPHEEVLFNLTLRGSQHVVQCGREVTLRAGDAVLATIEPAVTTMQASQFLSFRLRRAALAPLTANLDACLMRPVQPSFALGLLPAYVGALEEAVVGSVETYGLAVEHVYDLIALALGATRDAAEIATGRGVRAARLRAIKEDILAHLGDEGLSIGAVAARHGISPRYVGMLLEGIGTSFSSFVLEHRLRQAHRMVAASRHRGQTISAIVYTCGFGDLSYFNRAFRRAYGMTPSDVREAARENG